jgi:hypothetical protein
MGKSYRKTPIIGNAGGSEKEDKRLANRKFRKKEHQALHQNQIDKLPYNMDDVCDKWCMTKDGKRYINPNSDKKWTREYYKNGKWRRK